MIRIVKRVELAPDIFEMELHYPEAARKAKPGHFLMVHHRGDSADIAERIPLTVADADPARGTLTIVVQGVGASTRRLTALQEGAFIDDVLAPLGHATELVTRGRVIVVGGGVGVAPVYPLAKALREAGAQVTSVVGYRSKSHVFWEDRMRAVSHELRVMTNDGSYGEKGFVTEALRALLDAPIECVYAIGPAVMMQAVTELTRLFGVKTIVSLNSIMVCGLGMCGACRVTVDGKVRFTCKDGPDFNAAGVDFPELLRRLSAYRSEEGAK